MNFHGETSERRVYSDSVRRVYTAEYTESEVMRVVDSIRAAKASENHVQGQLSNTLDFRKALTEVFFLILARQSVSLVKRWLRTIIYK